MQERALKETPKIRREHEKKNQRAKLSQLPYFGTELYIAFKTRKRAIELHKVVPLKNNKQANKQTAR